MLGYIPGVRHSLWSTWLHKTVCLIEINRVNYLCHGRQCIYYYHVFGPVQIGYLADFSDIFVKVRLWTKQKVIYILFILFFALLYFISVVKMTDIEDCEGLLVL